MHLSTGTGLALELLGLEPEPKWDADTAGGIAASHHVAWGVCTWGGTAGGLLSRLFSLASGLNLSNWTVDAIYLVSLWGCYRSSCCAYATALCFWHPGGVTAVLFSLFWSFGVERLHSILGASQPSWLAISPLISFSRGDSQDVKYWFGDCFLSTLLHSMFLLFVWILEFLCIFLRVRCCFFSDIFQDFFPLVDLL